MYARMSDFHAKITFSLQNWVLQNQVALQSNACRTYLDLDA